MSRRHNPELAKLHLTYTILEIAALFHVGKTQVSKWISAGLPTIDRKVPLLVTGVALRAFLKARMDATKRPCQPGEIFCVACKRTGRPEGDRAILKAVSETSSNLIGICTKCGRRNFRRVALRNMSAVCAGLTLTFEDRDDTYNTEA